MIAADPIAVAESEGVPPPASRPHATSRTPGPFVILLSAARGTSPLFLLGPRGNLASFFRDALTFDQPEQAAAFVREQAARIEGYNAYVVDWGDPLPALTPAVSVTEDDGDPD